MVKRRKSIKKVFPLLFVSLLMFSSCDVTDSYGKQSVYLQNIEDSESDTTAQTGKPIVTEPAAETGVTEISETTTVSQIVSTVHETEPAEIITEAVTEKAEKIFPPDSSIDVSSVPEYSDAAYVEINNNKPYFEVFTNEYFEKYSELDSLGRCGTVFEMLGPETMPEAEREGIGMIKPSGWHTVKYPELIPDLYLYNRCHLIGYQLCGKNADERNLITGTRYMNVSGMLQFEDKTAEYIRQSGNHVLYRVTPVFDGSNLVASGVLMEALSVEDNGSGLSFCVFCYNIQPGIEINYSDGESQIAEEPVQTESEEPEEIEKETVPDTENTGQEYILNTNTNKFHYPSCKSVKQMKEENKKEYTGTRDEIISQGYSACKNCDP